ncbi:dUTP diphosphatase [Rickettsiales endosymbiont of Stachyamoeba lipophora]|uniref:dUTP diphosphatase n=1 Tax=Rickettsiales endosymbiont of Stachyamoeba lipophora TaxID=2486578 RepID=UPI000F65340C|nr:dUTP diphosphatase [Rickettsiales endosymbiont of Stachyamoeba lipophora]AZL16448.1 dUTP diphosphatase [Rickettsiales endosymbiont of Stachyamoeba lipophora]
MQIEIIKLANGQDLELPFYATKASAGMDLMAATDEEIIIAPGEVKLIPTGIAIALPVGFEAQIRPRSGLALKNNVTVLNSPGTIDADYRGEIKVMLINFSKQEFIITKGLRIAQMIIAQHETAEWKLVEELSSTTIRGDKGFGSTGA